MSSAGSLSELATEAFIYGFPLVFDLQEVDRIVRQGLGSVPPTPLNRFGHAASLAGPEDKFVSINNDTVYSIANVDVGGGLEAGREQMEQALRHSSTPKQNGWDLTYHAFDYNLDFFEVGALDSDQWKLPDGPGRYLRRALAARGGLWGNHGYEAAYAAVYDDADGQPLDGSRRYELSFERTPPCDAFWSVTMYDVPDFYLVANPLERYSIGDRTPGLRPDADGRLTIALQRDEPSEPERRAGWLPTPEGQFRPLLRMYEPHDSVFNGGFELPPIRRTG